MPSGGGTSGLTSVATDSTITGDGTSGSPLGVANPFTDADETKLDGIEANATADQTGSEIVTAIDTQLGSSTWQSGGSSGPSEDDIARGAQTFNEMIEFPSVDARVFSNETNTATIEQRADLDGDYTLILKEPASLPNADSTIVNADRIRISIEDSDGGTTIVHTVAWTLVQGIRVVPFNISTAEETGAANRFQRADSRTFYSFKIEFLDGNNVEETLTYRPSLWLEEGIISPSRDVDQTARDAAAAANTLATTADGKADTNSGRITTNRNAITAAQASADSAQTTANNANTTANTARTEVGELKDRFEEASPRLSPDYWLTANTDARTYILHVDPDITLGHSNILVRFQGSALGRIAIVEGQSTYTLSVDATTAANVARAIGNANPDLTNITVEIEVLDGATVEDERQIQLAVLATAPGGSDVELVEARQNILQNAVDNTGSTGVTTVTLPSDWATYKELHLSVGVVGALDGVVEATYDTVLLAAQTVTRNYILPSDQDGNAHWFDFNPTTRELGAMNDNGPIRILFCDLETPGGVKGDKGDKGDPGVVPVRRTREILAPVDVSSGAATLGVNVITLPADYATYHDLNLGVFETQEDALSDHDFSTKLLAAQTGTSIELTISGNPGAPAAAKVTWNPTARTITAIDERNAPVQIVYAELHD